MKIIPTVTLYPTFFLCFPVITNKYVNLYWTMIMTKGKQTQQMQIVYYIFSLISGSASWFLTENKH